MFIQNIFNFKSDVDSAKLAFENSFETHIAYHKEAKAKAEEQNQEIQADESKKTMPEEEKLQQSNLSELEQKFADENQEYLKKLDIPFDMLPSKVRDIFIKVINTVALDSTRRDWEIRTLIDAINETDLNDSEQVEKLLEEMNSNS